MDETLSNQVYESIVRQLHAQKLTPGQMIKRRDLAEQQGVSVAPVLEALVRLELEGFVETLPRKGTRIRRITLEDMLGLLTVREALETQAARMNCGRPIRNRSKELMALAREADRSPMGDIRNWQLELQFHRQLMELADCPALLVAFDRVVNLALFHAANDLSPPQKHKLDPHSHETLLKGMKSDCPDTAAAAMRFHLRGKLDEFASRG